jgi:hypothetical protein
MHAVPLLGVDTAYESVHERLDELAKSFARERNWVCVARCTINLCTSVSRCPVPLFIEVSRHNNGLVEATILTPMHWKWFSSPD